MKKLYLDASYSAKHITRSKKRHARSLRHKEWKRRRNASVNGVPKSQRHPVKRLRKNDYALRGYELISAPANFSFIHNTNEVVEFIVSLKNAYDTRQKVFVVLDEVLSVDYGAIVVLLSIMVKFKSSGIGINGNFPKNSDARRLLIQSGFFENLYKTEFQLEDSYKIGISGHEGICTHAHKKVDSVLGSEIISEATQTVWGEIRRCPGVQRTLVELMQNTNNHAAIGKTGEKHWWLSVNHGRDDKKVMFSFVDFGVGIFENLNNKTDRSKFYNWKERIKDKLFYGNNSDLLRLILDGSLHRTVTENDYRGKGLPGIAEVMRRKQISNLHIISNDAYADVSGNRYMMLSKSFDGTFVYWELSKENDSKK